VVPWRSEEIRLIGRLRLATTYVDDVPAAKEHVMLGLIVTLIIIGLIAGAVARLVVPGKQDLSILGTIILGIVGSFVGGFLGYLLFQHDASGGFFQPAGLLGSIIGSIIVLLIYVRIGRSHGTRNTRGARV
jgi:uncharacterized membrane protein YeaQ/YmgE (transglycosylase-associated protein family)